MTEKEIAIRKEMDAAAKEDRERFFAVADTLHLQPKYSDRLAELEQVKQQWRDITELPDYPNITFPLPLPDWFPRVRFASRWERDKYLQERLTKELREAQE